MAIIDDMADRYAKKTAKKEMRKISKIFYNTVKAAYKEGCLVSEIETDFCKNECKMWNTEYRCRDCKK